MDLRVLGFSSKERVFYRKLVVGQRERKKYCERIS